STVDENAFEIAIGGKHKLGEGSADTDRIGRGAHTNHRSLDRRCGSLRFCRWSGLLLAAAKLCEANSQQQKECAESGEFGETLRLDSDLVKEIHSFAAPNWFMPLNWAKIFSAFLL